MVLPTAVRRVDKRTQNLQRLDALFAEAQIVEDCSARREVRIRKKRLQRGLQEADALAVDEGAGDFGGVLGMFELWDVPAVGHDN